MPLANPLQFPTARILPAEIDATEFLIQTVGQVALDFGQAITAAHSVSRALQLRERIEACIQVLIAAEFDALAKADSL